MGCSSENEERNQKLDDFFYCFNKEEIALIKQLKGNKEQTALKEEEGPGKKEEGLSVLFVKRKIDLTKREKTLTEYLVLYLPSSFSSPDNSTKFDYV